MIDERELQKWIARLECEDSSWNNYEKLAALYIIQNQQERTETRSMPLMYSSAPAPESVSDYGDSDFLRAVSGKDADRAWAVMDELMDDLHIVNERVYNSVMRKLQAI